NPSAEIIASLRSWAGVAGDDDARGPVVGRAVALHPPVMARTHDKKSAMQAAPRAVLLGPRDSGPKEGDGASARRINSPLSEPSREKSAQGVRARGSQTEYALARLPNSHQPRPIRTHERTAAD